MEIPGQARNDVEEVSRWHPAASAGCRGGVCGMPCGRQHISGANLLKLCRIYKKDQSKNEVADVERIYYFCKLFLLWKRHRHI